MKTFFVFVKKECMELLRTGKLTVLLIIFILFGIMNPAIAKLTPWLMEAMADTLAKAECLFPALRWTLCLHGRSSIKTFRWHWLYLFLLRAMPL